jgi:Tfp pilus assembly protein PilF
LALLAIAVYLPSLSGEFLWDDNTSVTESEIVHDPGGWWKAWVAPPRSHPDYFPLTTTAFWLQWRLWGLNPVGYHCISVLLHAGCVVLFHRLLRELKFPGAWAAAALVAVHPVNVESVAWIAEQKNLLCLIFALPAFQYFVRWHRDGGARDYRISLGCHAAALAAKASVVGLPVAFAAYLFWRGVRPGKRELLGLAPFLLASLLFGLLVIHFQHHRAMGAWSIEMPGLLARIGGASSAWWFYLGKILWPMPLATLYPRWTIDPPQAIHLFAALVIAVGLGVLWRGPSREFRSVAFGLTVFSLLLAPALGFIKMSFMRYGLVADHFQHLALPAVGATLVCGGAALLPGRSLVWKRLSQTLVIGFGVLFCGLTWQRAALHASHDALWKDALAKNRSIAQPHNILGSIAAAKGDFPAAEGHFREAVRLQPGDAQALTNLGLTFADRGRLPEALPWFQQAAEAAADGSHPPAFVNLARTHLQLGQSEAGLRVLGSAAERFPENLLLNSAAGASLLLAGKPAEALAFLERSERLDPRGASTKFYLAQALGALGRGAEAAGKQEEAERLDPTLRGARMPAM